MGYIEVFNQIDQNLSSRIGTLKKRQEELIDEKKQLLETKQKVHSFLSDAHEIKKVLDFSPELVHSIQAELYKIFQPESKLEIQDTKNVTKVKLNSEQTTPNPKPEKKETQPKRKQATVNNEKQEPIKVFNFVDIEGKNTSF